MPTSSRRAPLPRLAFASSVVCSSSPSPLTTTRSASDSALAALGGGANVWEFVPSGTIPEMSARSPATAAAIEVSGATVVTTLIRSSAPRDPDAAPPVEPDMAAAVVDVFVYVVVLNLFVEYVPQILTETFTISLLTAVLLKGVLEVVLVAKNRVKARFRQASTPVGKVVAAFMLWAVLSTLALQIMVIYLPFFQATFETVALDARELAVSFAAASLVLFVTEIEKLVRRPTT